MAGRGIPFPAPSETQRERALASPNTPVYFARAVREYYGGTDPGSFLKQIAGIWPTTPRLFLFQAFRAVQWTAFAVPAIQAVKSKPWEKSLTMAVAFPILASAPLLIPNPCMPVAVERAHLIETSSSNFIFGWIVGWLLSRG